MKKLILATALIAASGLGGVAVAQTPAGANATATAQVAASNPAAVSNIDSRQVPAPGSRNCVRETGSHIPPPKGGCLPVNGTSYSREELERTGQVDIGRALQQLDPSVQISGH